MTLKNFQVVLQSRPGANGVPTPGNFRFEECPFPSKELSPGEILLRTCYLSVDPALRCTLNEDSGVDYISAQQKDKCIQGTGNLAVVEKSAHPDLAPGDRVSGFISPWALYCIVDFNDKESLGWQKIDPALYGDDPAIPLYQVCALTSLIGLWEKGHITAGANQTLVVSGAAGACGSLAGQMGKLLGCSRVIGICGSKEKCDWLIQELGFDGAVNYKSDDIDAKLIELCPQGVDVYFDNVGGDISEKVISQMNHGSHVILCGQISQYNKDVPYPPPLSENLAAMIRDKNITRERFLVVNYPKRFPEALVQFIQWVNEGKVKIRTTIEEGLEQAGAAFVSMMEGGNFGKQLVHVSNFKPSNL